MYPIEQEKTDVPFARIYVFTGLHGYMCLQSSLTASGRHNNGIVVTRISNEINDFLGGNLKKIPRVLHR